jgi:hypothetical protein
MSRRVLVPMAGLALVAATVSAQQPQRSTQPRTPWGHPDFQGTWNIETLTPLERPDNLGDRLTLTKEEADTIAKTEQARIEQRNQPSRGDRSAPPVGGDGSGGAAGGVGGYNYFWINRGSGAMMIEGQYRTSIIVDPVSGKVPPMTPEAKTRNAGARGSVVRPTSDAPETAGVAPGAFDDPELRPLAERCIIGFGSTSGPPTLPNYFYNNLKQIVQTPDYVMILVEMIHDVRVIRLNDRHAPPQIQGWMGDSIGRFEGDTLVVETTNFTNKTRFRGSSERLKVTERFRRLDDRTLLYRFTIEDPATWERPWTGEYPWVATDEQIYEYACHEGNYSFVDIMKGERLLDSERAAASKK